MPFWLEDAREPEPTDSDLDDGPEYAPGPRFHEALEVRGPDEYLLQLTVNGLRIHTDRRVFPAVGNGLELTCAACGSSFEPGDGWSAAVERWYEGDDEAAFACPSCGKPDRLAEWRGPWPWGFGHLGLEFCNWPPLADAFVRAVEARLRHRTVPVRCRI